MKTFKEYLTATLFILTPLAIFTGIHFIPGAHDTVEITRNQAIMY